MNINFMTDFKHVHPDDWQDTEKGVLFCVAVGTVLWIVGGLLAWCL